LSYFTAKQEEEKPGQEKGKRGDKKDWEEKKEKKGKANKNRRE
jgi:hypothetical protein